MNKYTYLCQMRESLLEIAGMREERGQKFPDLLLQNAVETRDHRVQTGKTSATNNNDSE